MPKILESEALVLANSIDAAAPEDRPWMLDVLTRYQSQQFDNGDPEWPTQAKQQAEAETRFRSMFDAPEKVPYDPGPYAKDPNAERASYANAAFIANRYNVEFGEAVDRRRFYMDDYAAKKGQKSGLDEMAFYNLAKGEVAETKLAEDTRLEGAKAALRGEDVIGALQAWQGKNLDRLAGSTDFTKGYLKAKDQAGDYLPMADELLKLMESQTGQSNSARTFDTKAASRLDELAVELASMKPRERKQVYASIAARSEMAGYEQKGFWSQMLGELDKGLLRMSSTVGTTAGNAADVMRNFPAMLAEGATGNRDFGMKPGEVANTDETIAQRQALGEIHDELASIVSGTVDPVRPTIGWLNDTVETGLIKGPGAVMPFMAATAALGPWGGGMLFTADFAEQNRRDLRAAGMDNDRAIQIGTVAAPLQAAVESLSNMLQLGKFTKLQSVLANFTKPIGGGAGLALRYAQNTGISLATEYTEEQLQDNFIVPAVQEIVGALAADVPEVDWSFYKTRAAESTPELLSVLAPMALVFGGVMTGAQANLSREMTSNIDALKALNYSEAQATEIVAEKTEEGRIAKASSMWGVRAGDKTTLEEGARSLSERMRQLSGDVMAQQQELERRGILPRMLRATEDQWRLTFQDGSTAAYNSHAEADAARWTWTEDQLGKFHALTRETLSSMERNLPTGRELAVEISPDARFATPEEMSNKDFQDRIAQGKVLDGLQDAVAIDAAMSGDSADAVKILGTSNNEMLDGVLRTTIRLYEGANILTLVEEKLEGDIKVILSDAEKRRKMIDRLREYEALSGDSIFADGITDENLTTKMIVEAWSHLGQSYLVGRSTFGEPLQAKTMRRFGKFLMGAKLMGAMNAEAAFFEAVVGRAKKLGELQKAGKLGADLTAELEKQLGIDSQVAHDAGAEAEARQLIDTSGYSEGTPGPNGETFSLASSPLKGTTGAWMDRSGALTVLTGNDTHDSAANKLTGLSGMNGFDELLNNKGFLRLKQAGWAGDNRLYFNGAPTLAQRSALKRLNEDFGYSVIQDNGERGERVIFGGETFSLSRATPADASNVVQMPDGARLVGPTTFSIRAFHGTPHKVDRFRTDKIGTGEGAQAYGYGLYFAESREVGEGYRDKLAQWTLLTSDGKIYDDRKELKNLNVRAVLNKNGSIEEAIARAKSVIESIPGTQGAELALADISTLEELKGRGGLTKTKGNLYTVELLPDESEFLDWDKPLSEQSEKVKGAFSQLHKSNKSAFDYYDKTQSNKFADGSIYGSALYARLSMRDMPAGNDAQASSLLVSMGVKGIRYLDGGSRQRRFYTERVNGKIRVADDKSGKYTGPVFENMDEAIAFRDELNSKEPKQTYNYVIFDENLVRILEENGKPVGETFSVRVTPAQDAEYMAAVESGDVANQQAMVDAAAKAAGLTELFHGSSANEDVKTFEDRATSSGALAMGVYMSPDIETAQGYGKTGRYWVDVDLPGYAEYNAGLTLEQIAAGETTPVEGKSENGAWKIENGTVEIVVRKAAQIKSADPITRDESGNVIPLSKRFNPADDRITYSLRSGDFASRAAAMFSPFQRSPEARMAIARVAKERAMRLGAEWIEKAAVIRSASSINREVAFREADGFDRRMTAYLDSLTPNARQNLEFEPASLEDDPLISAMLDFGKLMSQSTAKRQGKVESKSGDYDGAPWIPPAWYSKGSGIMPDQMAQAMFDAGLLPDAYTGTFWDAVASRIESSRKDKAAYREAVQAFRDAKKTARTEAKTEAEAWGERTKKTAGSPKSQRDMLKAALRTLDGILSAAPHEVQARVGGYVKLAGLATDEAMLQEIERRVAKMNVELEKWLKKEYLQRIAKLFKRFAPKKDDKGRITSNITAEAAEDIGFAFDFASLDDANQEKEMGSVEKTLEESEDAAEIQDAIGKLAIFQLFHNLEKRESSELEAAAMWLDELGSGAREARKIIDAARAEQVKAAKDVAKADASNGKLSSLPDAENVEADARSSTFKRFTNDVKGFLNSALFTMGQQLEIVFGQDSRITTEFHRRAVRAANDSTDIKRDIEARRAAFVADLFGTTSRIKQAGRMGALTVPTASGVIIATGGKAKTIDVPAEIVVRIIEGTADLKALGFTKEEAATLADAWADNEALPVKRQKRVFQIERRSDGKDVELRMSQDAAIQYLLWSNQKASREQMERDGWSKESFQQLNAFLSDDARALAKFFADEYARLGRLIEPVYRRMFHAPFPQVANYSPIFRDISKADSIIDIDQQGHGSGVSSGFILARNKNARSALRRTSSISAFMQHAESAAHWIAHVELVRDLRSVLIDKEVQNAIRSSGRTAAANGIKKRVMQLENQGKVGAAGIAELDSWGSRLLQARAFKGLAFRISPVMKQASAYFNPLLADVPAWDYMRGTARLLSGQLDVSAMWNSPDIQRRIEMGFSAESRIAMDKLGYTGSTLLAAMGKGMLPMQLMDAGLTTAGAAIAFDYYRRNNIKSGMNEAQAESAALDQLEMMIAESAQPADPANRSLIEGLQNPWLKSMWMFASEYRKTLAVEIMALRRLATGKSKNKAMDVQRAVVAHVIMATTTQLMAGVLSLLMGDDDDREREWSVEEWAAAIAAGPINGLFLFGDAFNYIGRRLFGLHAFEPSTAIGQAVKAVSSAPSILDEAISGEPEEQRKAILKLGEAFGQAASIVGPGNPFTAVDVIIGNPLKDAEKILSRVEE